jgi:hypothetical protein
MVSPSTGRPDPASVADSPLAIAITLLEPSYLPLIESGELHPKAAMAVVEQAYVGAAPTIRAMVVALLRGTVR